MATFSEQIEQSLVNMPMWTSKTITGKDKDRILTFVQKFIDNRSGQKHGFMVEIEGNTIYKYRTLSLDEFMEWNRMYYSDDRIYIRNDRNWLTKIKPTKNERRGSAK